MDIPIKYNKGDLTLELIKSCYDGYLKINEYHLQHKLFNGQQSRKITRELFERGHAAGVLLYDPNTDQVVLIEQIRVGAIVAGCSPWQLEIVAGMLDKEDETPEEVAYRETKEEAGLDLISLKPIINYLASAGGSSETLQIYLGIVDATLAQGIHGLLDEDEDIKVHVIDREEVYQWITQGKIPNAATIIAMQWLQLNYQTISL